MSRRANELRELNVEELTQRVEDLRKSGFELRSRMARKELQGGVDIRRARRELARALTILNQKRREA